MIGLLRFVVTLIVLTVWTVVGLAIYVPLMARSIAIYSIVLSAASLGHGNISRAQTALERSIEFFPRGYSLIWKLLSGLGNSHASQFADDDQPSVNFGRFALEVTWTVIFWWGSIASFFAFFARSRYDF